MSVAPLAETIEPIFRARSSSLPVNLIMFSSCSILNRASSGWTKKSPVMRILVMICCSQTASMRTSLPYGTFLCDLRAGILPFSLLGPLLQFFQRDLRTADGLSSFLIIERRNAQFATARLRYLVCVG